MKKFILSLLTVFSFTLITTAQNLSEGYIKMEFTDITSDDEQMAMQLSMLKGSTTEVYFSEGKTVSVMDMMGGMIKTKNHTDTNGDKSDLLLDAMGSKIWVSSTLSEVQEQGAEAIAGADITYDKADTKKILGYNAYKFTIKLKDAEGMSVTGYATKDIETDANVIQGMNGLKLDGFPLQFTVSNPMMKMTMETTEIKREVDKSMFNVVTEGYQKMTMKEFSESLGGLGGGLGF